MSPSAQAIKNGPLSRLTVKQILRSCPLLSLCLFSSHLGVSRSLCFTLPLKRAATAWAWQQNRMILAWTAERVRPIPLSLLDLIIVRMVSQGQSRLTQSSAFAPASRRQLSTAQSGHCPQFSQGGHQEDFWPRHHLRAQWQRTQRHSYTISLSIINLLFHKSGKPAATNTDMP